MGRLRKLLFWADHCTNKAVLEAFDAGSLEYSFRTEDLGWNSLAAVGVGEQPENPSGIWLFASVFQKGLYATAASE
jgi:hypothetical protein